MILLRQLRKIKKIARDFARDEEIVLGRFQQLRGWDDPITPEWFAKDIRSDNYCLIWKEDPESDWLKSRINATWSVGNHSIYKTVEIKVECFHNVWVIKIWS